MRRSVAEAAAAMGATSVTAAGAVFEGVAIDSRAVRGGELFFALPGERTDGHRYVRSALAAGAAAAVVERSTEAPAESVLIQVPDTFQALHDLTRAVRKQVPERLVAITGSAGKTTTKELLAAMLKRRFRVAKSPGNLNNLYGFPLALLNIPDDTEWMVAEMGMSTPGELREISRLGRPEVAMLLNVRPAHLEFFGTLDAIAEAKAEILDGLQPGGIIVANANDRQVCRVVLRHLETTASREVPCRVVWFGYPATVEPPVPQIETEADGAPPTRPTLDASVHEVEPLRGKRPGSRFRMRLGSRDVAVKLPLIGSHNIANALAAAACAFALGVDVKDIAAVLGDVRPVAGRGEVHKLKLGATLVDDSYNSNPEAAISALEGVAALSGKRRWAVLGEMRELGPETERFHREVGGQAAEAGYSPIAGVGEEAKALVAGAKAGGAAAKWFKDAAAAAKWAVGQVTEGDVVLVKGSRGVALEEVVSALRQKDADEAGGKA
ncbi:MAG: UDP-N-acetylmuramoyl-tripeptide--D-alanyl-D-alanine ligase [Acidobacteriota bacterium]